MWRQNAFLCLLGSALLWGAHAQPQPALDYQTFKTQVQPIFLKKRPGHLQCYVCHEASNNRGLLLEKLGAGQETWNEEQSRRNFDNVAKLVAPGDPDASWLLVHPLAPEGGGDAFHSGGRQFASKDDPDWRTLANWIKGSR